MIRTTTDVPKICHSQRPERSTYSLYGNLQRDLPKQPQSTHIILGNPYLTGTATCLMTQGKAHGKRPGNCQKAARHYLERIHGRFLLCRRPVSSAWLTLEGEQKNKF